MKPRCLPVIVLTVALLTGCTAGRTSRPPTTSPITERNGLAGSGGPESAGGSADFPVKPVPNAIQRVTYNSVRDIPGPGVYVVDLASGKVESWQTSGNPDGQRQFGLSDDRRWAVIQTANQVYWVNRQSGKTFRWNPRDLQLLTTGHGEFLFAGSESSAPKFFVTNDDFQVKFTFTLELGQAGDLRAQIAPDGKVVALNVSRSPAPGGKLEGHIYLVDVATGKSQDLGSAPVHATGRVVGADLLGPAGNESVVSYLIQVMEPSGLTREESIIRRYSWQGRLLGEFTVSGRAGRISPDGRLLVSNGNFDLLTDASLVTDMSTGHARFRVLGAYGVQWTADASRLVLEGRNGKEYLVSSVGELSPAPSAPGGGQLVFGAQLVAAQDDPHRFLFGLAVLDDSGKLLQSVELPKGTGWLVPNGDWGVSTNELVIRIMTPTGKGLIGFDFPLPPEVQRPPFDSPFILRVQDSQGECLNLRDAPSRSSRVIRCLSTGTKLSVGDPSVWEKPRAAWEYSDEQIWLWARTEQGETGWVSLSSNSVSWTH